MRATGLSPEIGCGKGYIVKLAPVPLSFSNGRLYHGISRPISDLYCF